MPPALSSLPYLAGTPGIERREGRDIFQLRLLKQEVNQPTKSIRHVHTLIDCTECHISFCLSDLKHCSSHAAPLALQLNLYRRDIKNNHGMKHHLVRWYVGVISFEQQKHGARSLRDDIKTRVHNALLRRVLQHVCECPRIQMASNILQDNDTRRRIGRCVYAATSEPLGIGEVNISYKVKNILDPFLCVSYQP